ncbi:MAG: response regulator transcription factor [Sphingomicrobium sp.]
MTTRQVYVIDDDPDMLRSTEFLLQSMGNGVECFADGDLFLEALPSLRPGCIITDLSMPHISGHALKATLDERGVAWPMILMTSEDGQTRRDAEARGFAGYLSKPFSADALAAALDTAFEALERRGS